MKRGDGIACGFILVLAYAFAFSCKSTGLADEDLVDLKNAARLTDMAYRYQDAGSAPAALDRGANCAVRAILRNHKVDAGGVIDCAAP